MAFPVHQESSRSTLDLEILEEHVGDDIGNGGGDKRGPGRKGRGERRKRKSIELDRKEGDMIESYVTYRMFLIF